MRIEGNIAKFAEGRPEEVAAAKVFLSYGGKDNELARIEALRFISKIGRTDVISVSNACTVGDIAITVWYWVR